MTSYDLLHSGISELALLPFAAMQEEKLLAYLALLNKWNKTYQLTTITDEKEGVLHHLLDSLSLVSPIENAFRKPVRLLDVGSGGGTPGIPLAIARPDWSITLIDSNAKKTAFLQQVAIELDLPNVTVIKSRVERYQSAHLFDLIVSRAFASLFDFTSLTKHLLQPEGLWFAMKGVLPQSEMENLPLGIQVKSALSLTVPFLKAERHLIALHPQNSN